MPWNTVYVPAHPDNTAQADAVLAAARAKDHDLEQLRARLRELQGTCWRLSDGNAGEVYMLACVDTEAWALIALYSGNRWDAPARTHEGILGLLEFLSSEAALLPGDLRLGLRLGEVTP